MVIEGKMQSDNLEYQDQEIPDAIPDSEPSIDEIIKKEAQEYDSRIDNAALKKEADETDKHYNTVCDNVVLSGAQNWDQTHGLDDELIKKESEKWYWEERKYKKFTENLQKEVYFLYATMFSTESATDEIKKNTVFATLLHRDRRIYTIDENTPLENTVRDYATRQALSASEQLTPEEKKEFDISITIIALDKAMDDPKQKSKFLDEAYFALKEQDKDLTLKDIEDIYKVAMTYELSD